jgi:hypothetical protein
MYRTVRFRYAYPCAWEFDERGDPVTPGGRTLAVQIARSLGPKVACTAGVRQRDFYGWGFRSKLDKSAFYQVINAVDCDVYLTVYMPWYLVKSLLLRKPRAALECYCGLVSAALASIDGVSGAVWDPVP